jgi:hypothetical protein
MDDIGIWPLFRAIDEQPAWFILGQAMSTEKFVRCLCH